MREEVIETFVKARKNKTAVIYCILIAIAAVAALPFGVPVVFAKKASSSNQSENLLTAKAHSFTHGNDNILRVDPRYLPAGSRVLIVDDFLADGQASHALISIVEQAGCKLVGVGIAIEKGFQPGGKSLREAGVNLKSLAIVQGIENGEIVLAPED